MTGRILNYLEKEFVLNRDGWCCNRCGYVPFHNFDSVPWWAKKSYEGFHSFTNDLRLCPPVIFVTMQLLPSVKEDEITYNFTWLHGGELEFDHIIPIWTNGSLELDNVQALCHECHRIKTSMERRYTLSTRYTIHKFAGRLTAMP